jgi:hypothetical protein
MLLAALLEGHTFGEAAMFSNPALSWQGVAIGDPLYRPFKVGLDEQLQKSMQNSFSAYLCLRQINRLQAEGQSGEALTFARTQFVRQPSLALAYELAKLYAAEDEPKKAVEALKVTRYITVFSSDEIILVKKVADFLNKHGEGELALNLYRKLIDRDGLAKALKIFLLEGGAKIAMNLGETTLSSAWTLTAQKLKAPPPATTKKAKG